jgi:hypothetical protein
MSGKAKILAGCGCLAALLLLVLMGAGGGYWYWTGTPRYSLQQACTAFEAHDLAAFETHVDIDSLVESGIDALAAEASREGGGGALGAAVALMFRGKLAAELETQVRRAIEQGSPFEGRDPRRTRFQVGEVRRDGSLAFARVIAETRRGAASERLELELKLRRKDGHWQVFEIANLPEMWREAREHEKQGDTRP